MTSQVPALDISPETMSSYIERLGRCGEQPGGGLIRPQYSEAWVDAHAVLTEMMTTAGLEVHQDAVGNIFGTLQGTDDQRVILTGSHIDTVYLGGKYDGALGVLTGIAALDALRSQVGRPRKTLQVVGFCEEEASRFHGNFFGTRAILGLVEDAELDDLVDSDGVSLREAMRIVGLDPARVGEARRRDIDVFLELHIEQGRVLEDAKVDVGVVTEITSLAWQLYTVTGRADHAGTTAMRHRQDAMVAAAEMALAVRQVAEEVGDPAVATTGSWTVRPNGSNIVPAEVVFTVDVRHPDEAVLERMMNDMAKCCGDIAQACDVRLAVETVKREPASPTNSGLRTVLSDAADTCGATWRTLPSGAGHDSQLMARHLPTAMLFVPSRDGRSHSNAEYTTPEDCARAARVLATALHALAYIR